MANFYYYTNEVGLEEIKLFSYIKSAPLRGPDCLYGEGVYGTTIPPNRRDEILTLNEWGSYWKQQDDCNQINIDRAIHLLIPPEKLIVAASNPNILVHPEPIELSCYTWQVLMISNENPRPPQSRDNYFEVETDSSNDDDEDEDEDDDNDDNDNGDDEKKATVVEVVISTGANPQEQQKEEEGEEEEEEEEDEEDEEEDDDTDDDDDDNENLQQGREPLSRPKVTIEITTTTAGSSKQEEPTLSVAPPVQSSLQPERTAAPQVTIEITPTTGQPKQEEQTIPSAPPAESLYQAETTVAPSEFVFQGFPGTYYYTRSEITEDADDDDEDDDDDDDDEEDSSESSDDGQEEEVTGPQWKSWSAAGQWGQQSFGMMDPYTAMMMYGYGMQYPAQQSVGSDDSESEEDW